MFVYFLHFKLSAFRKAQNGVHWFIHSAMLILFLTWQSIIIHNTAQLAGYALSFLSLMVLHAEVKDPGREAH